MLRALAVSALGLRAALASTCACPKGFPPLPAGGFKSISGSAGCVLNYVQFEDAGGAVVFKSGSAKSGGQLFSVTCPGDATIASFSYECNANSGPGGAFPVPTYASLSTLGGVTCSNGSVPIYTGALNSNVCEYAAGYTQVGFLDCGADGSAPQSCATEGCAPSAATHVPCTGTASCQVIPPARGGPWPMMYRDAAHSNTGPARGPTKPAVRWMYPLPWSYALAVATDAASGSDVIYATTDGNPRPAGGFHAITHDGKPGWQWLSPDGGYMDCAPSIGSDGAVFVGETNAHAVGANGSLLWDVALNPAGPYASSSVLGPDGTLYFGTGSFQLTCFAYAIAPNGTVLWSVSQGTLPANVHVPPAVSSDGSTVYFNWADQLHALSAVDGSERWAAGVGGECAPSVGQDGTVYCGTAALNPADGSQRWATPPGAPGAATYVAPADGALFAIGDDGQHVYKLSSTDGSVAWAVAAGTASDNATAFLLDAGSSLFVRVGATVLSLSRASGHVQWNFTLPGGPAAGVLPASQLLPWPGGFAQMSDGTLLFVSLNETSTVYAIGQEGGW